ncbi:LysM peptidoglycan-binding domain-containing protein [Bacillus sp. FJAT-49705]|uniref:LysM peptidoglycan-binding domain-containing protein n=1 Tax=Cytobacillus citreus TaxID=2833586 RepID=A0ABS5NUH9_9BACI|nr:LysM peptidoglycan-binding domain-containing protein [Cytobacillus citreus]MBS4191485.1 LysM peptidoglycan-binding domain-containing protein [Cytobacillus citreus]
MSQGNQSCLRFSLEESVWFQKGQEVDDLITISLDPDILIQENDQYVTIQGALELSGEYNRYDTGAIENEETFKAPKFIQYVEEREEGVCEFTHYFPVDITIPNNRIENIQDIDVIVESFDYVFPERSCMKLTANLTISGLYGDQQRSPSFAKEEEFETINRSSAAVSEIDLGTVERPSKETIEEEKPVAKEELEEKEEIYIPFEAEARKQPELVEKEKREISEIKVEILDEMRVNEEIKVEKLDEMREEEEILEEIIEEVKVEEEKVRVTPEFSFSAQRNEESPPTAEEIYKMTEIEESLEQEVEVLEDTAEQDGEWLEDEIFELEEQKPAAGKEEAAPKKKKKISKKKSMTLTEFFARKTEDNVAKLKVCIVQNGDTVDTIAERYDITVQRLLSVNHIEINQDIYEGQVLYIPVTVVAYQKR